ncbi:MAG: phenylacetic acid degradation protein [Rhodospirillales bacterium 35-66-84]|nr:MAG: phenylacetic acid degradation protein [Rhodospirillales bacterium 35-66-84]
MDLPPQLPPFDQEVARRFLDSTVPSSGLPEFLGLRTTLVEPGRLRVELSVAPKLLTRFGNMHGGVLSALCDHALGLVCYPHMQSGQWAATTEFIIAMTRSTAVVRIDIENDGRACGAAQGTVLIMQPRPPKSQD